MDPLAHAGRLHRVREGARPQIRTQVDWCYCRDGGNTFTPERYRLELNSAHTSTGRQAPNPVGEGVCLSVGVCEGGGVRPPPRERVSRAAAEGRRAECVCEAESELEFV